MSDLAPKTLLDGVVRRLDPIWRLDQDGAFPFLAEVQLVIDPVEACLARRRAL